MWRRCGAGPRPYTQWLPVRSCSRQNTLMATCPTSDARTVCGSVSAVRCSIHRYRSQAGRTRPRRFQYTIGSTHDRRRCRKTPVVCHPHRGCGRGYNMWCSALVFSRPSRVDECRGPRVVQYLSRSELSVQGGYRHVRLNVSSNSLCRCGMTTAFHGHALRPGAPGSYSAGRPGHPLQGFKPVSARALRGTGGSSRLRFAWGSFHFLL